MGFVRNRIVEEVVFVHCGSLVDVFFMNMPIDLMLMAAC